MQVLIDVSLGELIDKITILQIKSDNIKDKNKLENIDKELKILENSLQKLDLSYEVISKYSDKLKTVNKKLWEIEDDIRDKEAKKLFDSEFISLARAVYITNDQREKVKKEINIEFGSELIEEKSYRDY